MARPVRSKHLALLIEFTPLHAEALLCLDDLDSAYPLVAEYASSEVTERGKTA